MEDQIRLVLLVIGAVIILAILWDGLRRQRRQRTLYVAAKTIDRQQQATDTLRDMIFPEKIQQTAKSEKNMSALAHATNEQADEVMPWYKSSPVTKVQQRQQPSLAMETITAELTMTAVNKPVMFKAENDEVAVLEQPEPELVVEEAQAPATVVNQPKQQDAAEIMAPFAKQESVTVNLYSPLLDETPPQQQTTQVVEPHQPLAKPANQLIIFTVVATGEKSLGGFHLLQALLNNGFRFGEGNIFHYHFNNDLDGKKMFSLAAATQTGEFELSNMANFSCKGLVIFMNSKEHDSPAEVFTEMVEATEKLAKSLHADLRVGQAAKWEEERLQRLHDNLL